jgi:hypothetical protein
VRPAGIYGPGDLRFLKLVKAIHRGWFVIIGSGRTLYHFTDIGFVRRSESTLLPPLHPRRLDFFLMDRSFSIAKARELLGYDPKVAIRDGFARTVAWYRQEGLV